MLAGSVRRWTVGLSVVLMALAACSSGSQEPSAPTVAPMTSAVQAPPPDPASVTSAQALPRPAGTPRGLPSSLRGGEWERLPTDRHVVALTFDAGANADAVESILGTLAANNVPATFFLTGQWAQRYPTLARRIAQSHAVGNHTQTHPALTTLSDARVEAELREATSAIIAATGRDPHPLFRFPFGDRNAHTIQLANAAGYGSIRWTVDTTGWRGTSGGVSVTGVLERVLSRLTPGEIVLMHVGSNPTDGSHLDADALPELIRQVRARGYEFVPIAEFL